MKKDKLQYSLLFDFEEQADYSVQVVRVDDHVSAREQLRNILPDYETFCQIKSSDLYAAEWVDEALLNVLVKNEKEYLIDFLRIKDTRMPDLKGVGQKRVAQLLSWKQQILADPLPYIHFYKQHIAILRLPEHPEEGLLRPGYVLLLFVRQYMAYLKRIHSEEQAQMVSLYLGLDGEPQTYRQIAGQFSLSPERIRQRLAEVSSDWMKLYQGETIGNIQASDELKDAFDRLYGFLYRPLLPYQMQQFILADATSEEEVVLRFLDLLNLLQLDLLVEEYSDQTKTFLIIHKNEKRLYQKAVSFLVSLMRTSPFWFSWDTIVREFREREDEQVQNRDLLLSILFYNPCFERTDDYCFRLKWPFLGNMQQEVRRILLDARRPLFRKEILTTYNSYSRLYGNSHITDGQLIITSDANFVNQNKSGLWLYSPDGTQMEDVRVFMSSYILANGGKIFVEELFTAVYAAGYQYRKETLRAYLTVFCRIGLHDKNLLIHKDCISQYPDIPLRKAQKVLKKRASPAYYNQVIQRTTELLEQQPFRQAILISISKKCEDLVPPEINKNILYKILRSSEQFDIYVNTLDNKKWIRLHPPTV